MEEIMETLQFAAEGGKAILCPVKGSEYNPTG